MNLQACEVVSGLACVVTLVEFEDEHEPVNVEGSVVSVRSVFWKPADGHGNPSSIEACEVQQRQRLRRSVPSS